MGAPAELPVTATLPITPELVASLATESQALAEVQDYEIDSPELAVIVNERLTEIKRRQKIVEEWDERFAAPIRQLETTRKSFFGPAKQALLAAEAHCKGLLKGWTEKERLRIANETRAREEAARREREKAEQEAAAARARAQAQAEEARRKQREAEEAERRAREAGNARAAAAAAAARAKAAEEEHQRILEGERKAAEAQLAASARANVEPAPAMQKLTGYSERKNWIAELCEGLTEEQAKLLIVEAICGIRVAGDRAVLTGEKRRDLLALLSLDMKAACRLAKALEANFNVPGLKARNDPTSSSRSK